MALATSSFPVPLSPVIRTVLFVALTTSIILKSSCIFFLFPQPPVFERAVHHEFELFDEILRLEDVIERSHLERLNRSLRAGEGGQQDELAPEGGFAKLAQEIDTRHVGHFDVGNNEIEVAALQDRQGFHGTADAGDVKSVLLQNDFQQFANGAFIVDNKYPGAFRHFLTGCALSGLHSQPLIYKSITNVVPTPLRDITAIEPLCALTI